MPFDKYLTKNATVFCDGNRQVSYKQSDDILVIITVLVAKPNLKL